MPFDLRQLLFGRLDYEEHAPALDDVRFERILRGFGSHYEITSQGANSFAFARGEGYQRFERWDAFAYVDWGHVERLRVPAAEEIGGNVVMMPPRHSGLHFLLGIRVILAFWAFAFVCGWLFFGGAPLLWGFALVLLYAVHVWLIVRSLKAKLARWLARESWN